MGDFGQNPMANQGSGWSAPKAMGGGGGPPPFMNGPPGGGGFGGPPGGGGFGGPPRGGGFGGPRGGGFGGPPRGGGFGGGFGGPPGGFNGGGGFGGGGGFRGGFRGRGRGRGKPAPTNVVKKRKGYKGAAQKQKEPAKPSRQLFVRPIENGTKVSEVRDYFQVFGELRDVYLPKDYYTKEMKGVAYVEYKEQEDAEEAQAAMDGCEFNGKNISVTFAQGDRKSKETMATGVYATNMEIEMLKKELAKEQERLSKAARGERISPPRFAELDDNGAPIVKPMVKDDRDRRRGDRRDRDRRRSRSRSPRRGLGGGRDRGPRDDEDDCPEFRKRPESDKDKIDDCPEFAGRPGRDDRSRSRRSSREPRSSRGDRDDRRDRDRDRDSRRRDRSRSRERRRSRDRR